MRVCVNLLEINVNHQNYKEICPQTATMKQQKRSALQKMLSKSFIKLLRPFNHIQLHLVEKLDIIK